MTDLHIAVGLWIRLSFIWMYLRDSRMKRILRRWNVYWTRTRNWKCLSDRNWVSFPSAVILCLEGQDLCFPFFRTRVGVERGQIWSWLRDCWVATEMSPLNPTQVQTWFNPGCLTPTGKDKRGNDLGRDGDIGWRIEWIGSLCCDNAEEAKSLIPSLQNKIGDGDLQELLDELTKLRNFTEWSYSTGLLNRMDDSYTMCYVLCDVHST